MISKATITFVQSLKQKKYRQKYNKFLLEGEKIILEGLEEGLISFDSIFCLKEKEYLLQDIKTNYNIINSKTLKTLSNLKSPPGIIAIANIPPQKSIKQIEFSGLSLFLDNIKDPGNMGTIIRTADWFGLSSIIATHESVEFYNPKVLQSSMGSFSKINLINANIRDLPKDLPLYTTSLEGESIYNFDKPNNLILVIGSESHGVSKEAFNLSKGSLTIPRNPNAKAESLNAGIATAIFLSHLSN